MQQFFETNGVGPPESSSTSRNALAHERNLESINLALGPITIVHAIPLKAMQTLISLYIVFCRSVFPFERVAHAILGLMSLAQFILASILFFGRDEECQFDLSSSSSSECIGYFWLVLCYAGVEIALSELSRNKRAARDPGPALPGDGDGPAGDEDADDEPVAVAVDIPGAGGPGGPGGPLPG